MPWTSFLNSYEVVAMNCFGVFRPSFLHAGFLQINASTRPFFLFLVPLGPTIQLPHAGHRIFISISGILSPSIIVMKIWCQISIRSLNLLPIISNINNSNIKLV
ncbi:MAG: hypothetical protein EU535_07465 [Promethearchaeota archaeon]|nr:MAG: hypothetical protein EU535_07465 [Candidatus Lokiarchaeota archaeon]